MSCSLYVTPSLLAMWGEAGLSGRSEEMCVLQCDFWATHVCAVQCLCGCSWTQWGRFAQGVEQALSPVCWKPDTASASKLRGAGGGGRGKPKWKKETLLWKSAISTLNRAGQPQQCSWRVRLMQKTLISVEISPWTVVGFGSTPSSLFPSTGSSETIFWELWNK